MLTSNEIVHPKVLHTFGEINAINPTFENEPIKTEKYLKIRLKKITLSTAQSFLEDIEKTNES